MCEFLNVTVPDATFPHENKNGELFEQNMKKDPMILKVKREIIRTSIFALTSTVIAILVSTSFVLFAGTS